MKDKILGCLVGAAAGDAMGAATEMRTRAQIEELFGGYVTTFKEPPMDTFARGSKPGQITDDFSVAYMTCEEILRGGGKVTDESAQRGLVAWSREEKYFGRFAGPTTREAVNRINGLPAAEPAKFEAVNGNHRATNGAAMKSAPVALFSGGDVDKAIADCITVCRLTHPNNIALSGAAAIAAATAAAMKTDATLYDVVNAGLYGAREGERIGREKFTTCAGPSVEKRIELAVQLAMLAPDLSTAIDTIAAYIGSGLMAAEAVPAVFGVMVAAKGDAEQAVCAAVNIGDDTDTVATMVGGVLGTLQGAGALPADWLPTMEANNDIKLAEMAAAIEGLL